MKIRIFSIVSIAFCFATTSLSLSGGAEAGEAYPEHACEEIDRKLELIGEPAKKIATELAAIEREYWRFHEYARAEMKMIQDQRRRLGCIGITGSRLERSVQRECVRLTKKRMDTLHRQEEMRR